MEYFGFWVIQDISTSAGQSDGGWEVLTGKGGSRKGFYGAFGVYARCMDNVLKGFFML